MKNYYRYCNAIDSLTAYLVMSLSLNLNSQIESRQRDRILAGRNFRTRSLITGLITAMVVMLFIFFMYILTDPRNSLQASTQSDHSGITLEQYALSSVPAPIPRDYLGSY